jgi:hypothetical protein
MAIFIESPWPFLLIGIAAEAVLAVLLVQTGRGKFLGAMLGVAVLTLAGLAVEHFVVTDRKAVANTLDEAVAAVEANDLGRVLACTAPTASKPRADARLVLGRFKVEMARMHNLEITINRLTSPPTATAKFVAMGHGQDRQGQMPYTSFSQHVVVELRCYDDRWLVTDCNIEDFDSIRH